jgi:carbon-monoxide dehydrogenase large subunit
MITGPTLEHVTARETLDEAVRLADLGAFRREQTEARASGRCLGFGLSTFIEPSPGPPDYAAALGVGASPRTAQRAIARLEPDGTLSVLTSQQPHGQGHETTLAQLAGDGLGVALGDVRVVVGDTRTTPFNLVGTGGSRSATLASGAVVGAVAELRARIVDIVSHVLEIDPDDTELVDGAAQVKGDHAHALTLRDVARIAYVETSRLPASAAPGLDASFDYAIPPGGWSQATHACWVEVDPEIGTVRILRYLVVEDCGGLIHPAVVDGQVRGGVAQGIGSVLLERFALSRDGQPLTSTFMDYLVPTASDIPRIEVHHLESPPQGPIDHRGVGEGGMIGAPPAVVNAIEDALRPFGVVLTDQHLPPHRIAALVAHARAGGPPSMLIT